jgi:predicted N-formylglutamate amidohydrolase
LLCDHATNAVPRSLGQLGLPAQEMVRHIAYDIGAQRITEHLSDALDMPAVIAGYSRLVIDLNRPEDDFTLIREIYDGTIVPGNRNLTQSQRQERIDFLFRPYHDAVRNVLEEKSRTGILPAVLSIHSFTDCYKEEHRPWHIGVLSNRDRRMAERILPLLSSCYPTLAVGDNKPYSGLSPYGYSIENHALPRGRPNVLFEIRQDLILDGKGQQEYGAILETVLKEALGDPSLVSRFQGARASR